MGQLTLLVSIFLISNVLNVHSIATTISGAAGWSGYFDGTNYMSIATHCQHNRHAYRSWCKSIPSSILNSFTFSIDLYPQFDASITSNITLLSIPNCLNIELFVHNGIMDGLRLTNDAFSWPSNNTFVTTSGSLSFTNSSWNNLAITFASHEGFNIYFNGNLSSSFDLISPDPLLLYNASSTDNRTNVTMGEGFVGQIDEVYFYDIVLRESDIYRATSTIAHYPYDHDIVLYLGFNDGTQNQIKDSTLNENDATVLHYVNNASFWKISSLNRDNAYTINEDEQIVISLYGYSTVETNNLSFIITQLPDKGSLFHVNIYEHITDQIVSVPTLITDTGNRVIFQPEFNEFSGPSTPYTSFTYGIANDDGHCIRNETVTITVLSVDDLDTLQINPLFSNTSHDIDIRGLYVDCANPTETNLSVTITTKTQHPLFLFNNSGLVFTNNASDTHLSFNGVCSDVNNALHQITQKRSEYIYNTSDTLSVTVTGLGKYYWGGTLTTNRRIGFGEVVGMVPRVTHVSTTYITPNGDGYVTVYGSDFTYTDYACVFSHNQSILVRPIDVRWNTMRCKVPHGGTAGTYTELYVQSLHNDARFKSHAVRLWFADTVDIVSIEPSLGDVRGNTWITVRGHGFVASPMLRCRFNHLFVSAQYISPNAVHCISPPYPHASVVQFSVEIDEYHQDNANLTYLYYEHPVVHSLHPVRGYLEGGIMISIYGEHFISDAVDPLCRFGDDEIYYPSASIMNATVIRCRMPPNAAGFRSVEVSMNDGYDWSDSGVLFEYMTQPMLLAIFPTIGPQSGATNLTITATHIRTELTHFCVFNGTINTTATVVSDTRIHCLAPSWDIHSDSLYNAVGVTVQSAWYHLTSRAQFIFIATPNITRMNRDFVHERGNIWCVVTGQNILYHDNLTLYLNGNETIDFEWFDKEHLGFYLSALMISDYIGHYSLHLNIGNFQHYSDKFYFNVTSNPQLLSVFPSYGRWVGGTNVTLQVANMFYTSHIACRFDGDDSDEIITATYINESHVQCVTPVVELTSFTQNIVKHIGITLNGIDFFDSPTYGNATFTYHGPIQITSLWPPYGPVSGSTTLTFTGHN
eukprot:470524_1